MKPLHWIFRCLVFVIPAVISGGCNPAPHGFPPVVPCVIIVQKTGTPLPQVTINLVPEGSEGWISGATSDASGVAEVRTVLGNYVRKGAPPGTYKAVLSQIPQIQTQYTQQEWFDMTEQEKQAAQLQIEEETANARSFPVEFESAATTPISIEVPTSKSVIQLDVSEWTRR